jgi:hypothetical protein
MRILSSLLLISIFLYSCKKNEFAEYEVNNVDVYNNSHRLKKGSRKNHVQYISILSTNLFQKPISSFKVVQTQNVISSIGDNALVNEIIISNYMNEPDVLLPENSLMRDDVETFVVETYKRFYVRPPSEVEKTFFVNYIEANPNVTVEMVYTSFAASDEYLFY